MRLDDIDVFDHDTYARGGVPHEQFAFLRAHDPVHWQAREEPGGRGYWAITKHADICRISKDPATFSSHRGGTIIQDYPDEALSAIRMLLLNMDPPQHSKFRKIVQRGFTPRMIAKLDPYLRGLCEEIVDRVAPRGRCDFVTDIAAELPLQVIAEMLGVPQEDRHKIFDWTNRLMGFDDPEYQSSPEDGQMAAMEMWGYANGLAEERRERPQDDLTTLLLTAEIDGEKLTVEEFNGFFLLLAVGGNETTRHSTSSGMLQFIANPDQRRALIERPDLIDTAVEEILRWATPQIYMRRTAMRDVEIRGKKIREGDKLALYYASANRDEEMFEDPFKFDVARRPNDHLAFGVGEHFCLGASLARLEIKVMFEEIMRRLPDIELDGEVRRLRSNYMDGIKTMPVRFTPEG